MRYMKCAKMPVCVYYIACLIYRRQDGKELISICGRKGTNEVSSLLKKSELYGGGI